MEQRLKHWFSPKIRGRKRQTVTQRPFSPPSFPARRKRWGRRRRVRNDHDGTSRRKRHLFSSVLVSSLSKPQTEFAVWVLWQICSNLSGASRQHPYPFCPFGTFPPDRGNRPLGGEPFSAAFSSASCRKPSRRAAGRKNRPPGPHICPQHAHVLHAAEQKTRNCAHCRRLRPRRRVFCVIFNVLSIKSLNFAGNNAKNFIF